MHTCDRCLLHSGMRGITVTGGLCSECRTMESVHFDAEQYRARFDREMTALAQSPATYHALVMFSGGKDSAYLCHMLKRVYGLRILAFSVVHPFVNELAQSNMRRVSKILGVDHVEFFSDEEITREFLRYGVLHGFEQPELNEFFCTLCGGMLDQIGLKMAIKLGVPYMMSGMGPTQTVLPRFRTGDEAKAAYAGGEYFAPLARLFKSAFGTRHRGSMYDFEFDMSQAFPAEIDPFSFLDYDKEAFTAELTELGLDPDDFDSSKTNCDVMHFFAFIAYLEYGVHPYTRRFSAGLRKGVPTLLEEYFGQHVSRENHQKLLDEVGRLSEYLAASGDFDLSPAKLEELAPFGVSALGAEFFYGYVETVRKYLGYFEMSPQDAALARNTLAARRPPSPVGAGGTPVVASRA